jgi:membrane protein
LNQIERRLLTLKPIAYLIRKSKEIIIPGFQGIPLFDVIQFFFSQINRIGLNDRAAVISFNVMMAIPAACLFLFSVVPYLPVSGQFREELLALTKDITPDKKTYVMVEEFLTDYFTKSRGGLISFGFLLVIFYASNAMMGIIRAFDQSILDAKTYFMHKRWRAIRLTLILILLLICVVFFLMGHDAMESLLKGLFGMKKRAHLWWWENSRWLVIILLIFLGISFIYKYAPSVKKRWNIVSPGSLLATFLMLATTIGFSFWVNHFGNYNKVYGSIGTVMVIMVLIELNSLILLIGFELNVSITSIQKKVAERDRAYLEEITTLIS